MIFRYLRDFEFFSILQVTMILIVAILALNNLSFLAMADGVRLPGEDASSKMESAATLLRFIDTGLFKWSARLLAGLCIFSAGWSLKEMRFGPAVISLIAAILFGTAPTWVKNIFSLSSSDSVFSNSESTSTPIAAASTMKGESHHA
jgi:hypothetical protein